MHAWDAKGLDKLYSEGCFAVSKKEWPQFRSDLLKFQEKNGGKAYLNIGPKGATITAQPTWGPQKNGVQEALARTGTQLATGPKWGTDAYWNRGKVAGDTQVAKAAAPTEVAKAPDFSRRGQTQVAHDEHHEAEPQDRPRSEPRLANVQRSATTAVACRSVWLSRSRCRRCPCSLRH
jgi:hypothetical protein